MENDMNLMLKAFFKSTVISFLFGSSLVLATPTQIMRVTMADGSVQRILVDQVSKISFQADLEDSTGITGLYVANRNLDNKISWLSQKELLHVFTNQSGFAEIAIYDLKGNRVANKSIFISVGQNSISFASDRLKNGIYVVRIKKDGVTHSKYLNLVK